MKKILVILCAIALLSCSQQKNSSEDKTENKTTDTSMEKTVAITKLPIMGKEIDLQQAELLYNKTITEEIFQKEWKIYGGEWKVDSGWFIGKNPENAPAMIIANDDFKGNVVVEFDAGTILPSTHDIDVMWNGSWDEKINKRGVAYIAGIEGWWVGKVGIERSPEYKFFAGTPLFDFKPGKIYHIHAGSVDGHIFVFVDGKLILEATDLNPIDNQKYAKVGFEAYASHIKIGNVKIYRVKANPVQMSYPKEF